MRHTKYPPPTTVIELTIKSLRQYNRFLRFCMDLLRLAVTTYCTANIDKPEQICKYRMRKINENLAIF